MFSKIEEFIKQSEEYIDFVHDNLFSQETTSSNKERFFLDNRDDISNCLTNLRLAKERLQDNIFPGGSEEEEKVSKLVSRIESLSSRLYTMIDDFKDAIIGNINNDSTIEDITPVISKDTVSDAMKNNKDIKQLSKDIDEIARNEAVNSQRNTTISGSTKTQPKYALVAKGKTTYIHANTKDELTKKITNVLNSIGYNGPDVKLYEISYKELKLKTQTIYTI